jgi:hypothetical protein
LDEVGWDAPIRSVPQAYFRCLPRATLVDYWNEAIGEGFSRKVAALLHPDSTERAHVAKSLKKLYQVRPDTLHGNKLPEKSDKLGEARLLAAGVLGAILEWRDFQKRSGENTDREVFLDQLEKAERAERRMVQIPEGFKNCLPGAPKASPAP